VFQILRTGGKAWTSPPVKPFVQPSSITSGVSLVAIQQLQLEEGVAPGKDKLSLREIQEEEQARQVEADFMKWWSAEEERVKARAEANARPKRSRDRKASKGKASLKPSTLAQNGLSDRERICPLD
jgi:inhibitor of Bruton tyrosine kinase